MIVLGLSEIGNLKEGELTRGQALKTRKFDWDPLFRSTNLCYGPARSGEGIYCVTALMGEKTGAKIEG